MPACTECGATHTDACTYQLCPRRKIAQPSGRTAHRGGGASNVIAPVKFSSFHAGLITAKMEQ